MSKASQCPFSLMLSPRFLLGLGLLGLVLFLTAYFGMPYYTLGQIKKAVDERDTKKLASHVDFPVLRENIKIQLRGEAGRALQGGGAASGEGGLLGALFTGFLADKAVDFLVTPQGLETLLQGRANLKLQKASVPAAGGTGAESAQSSTGGASLEPAKPKRSFSWKSMTEFAFSTNEETDQPLTLVLSRRGILGWKLTNVLLPVE
ncbi:MAG: DUF2939 domain-containing protein [Blastochloris sp.]|nr:DUF2939 domain-containing protein [Blastochloris sp.]